MENSKSSETESVNYDAWRTLLMAIGIWLIGLFLIALSFALSVPNYIIKGTYGVGLGLLFCASSSPITIFRHRFSGAFRGAIGWGLFFGLSSALPDFVKHYFGL